MFGRHRRRISPLRARLIKRWEFGVMQQLVCGDGMFHTKHIWRSDVQQSLSGLTNELHNAAKEFQFPHSKLEGKLVFSGGSNGEVATGLGNEMLMFRHTFPVCFWTGLGLDYGAELRIEVHNYEGCIIHNIPCNKITLVCSEKGGSLTTVAAYSHGVHVVDLERALFPPLMNKLRNENIVVEGISPNQNILALGHLLLAPKNYLSD